MRPPTCFSLLILLCGWGVCCAAEPKRDRFGDPLPDGAIARLGSLCLRPQWPVITGAFAPDGKLLAAGGCDVWLKGGVLIWDTASGKEVRRLSFGFPFSVYGLRFSADGKSLILAGSDGIFRRVDAVTGAEQQKLDTYEKIDLLALELARDGKTAATTDRRGSIIVWDLFGGKRLREFKIPAKLLSWSSGTPLAPIAALATNGKQLVLPRSDGSLHLMDVASGKQAVSFEPPDGAANRELPIVAVSRDGRCLAYGNRSTPVTLCDLKTGKRLHSLTAAHAGIEGLFFTSDSRAVIAVNCNAILLFDAASGKSIRKYAVASEAGTPLALSPDGKTLAMRTAKHALSLWDLQAGRKTPASARHVDRVEALVFFPDGKRLASSDANGNLLVWSIASAQVLAHHRNAMMPPSLAIDSDGQTLRFLTYDRTIYRWNPTAERVKTQQMLPDRSLFEYALSPDGRTVAATMISTPFAPELHDLQGKRAARSIAMPANVKVWGFLFSPDSRLLLTGATDRTLRLWERDTGKLVREITNDEANLSARFWNFANDSRSLAYSCLNRVVVREITTGGTRLNVSLPQAEYLQAFSPNGRFLACGQTRGGAIFVLDAGTGKQLARWQTGQTTVDSLAFSPDSRVLASGGGDGTILLWKLPDGESLLAALKAEEATALWQTLADGDAARANRALAGLAAAPVHAVPLIKERFRTAWKKLDDVQIARLIADLDDDAFKVRERATRQLAEIGFAAANALQRALADPPSPEAKRRIKDLLNRLNNWGDTERLRCLRALEVLERIGTPAAKDALRELAGKPLPAELDDEIRASLRRLGERR
jgi:WD40 repeat protein